MNQFLVIILKSESVKIDYCCFSKRRKCSESSLDLKRFGLVLLSCLNLHSVLNEERIAKPRQNASNSTGALNTAISKFIFIFYCRRN